MRLTIFSTKFSRIVNPEIIVLLAWSLVELNTCMAWRGYSRGGSKAHLTKHITKHLTKRLREGLVELNTCIAGLQHRSRLEETPAHSFPAPSLDQGHS